MDDKHHLQLSLAGGKLAAGVTAAPIHEEGVRLRCLHVGGLVAMGFDPSGEYLLTISHAGRGVFSTRTWERLARDSALAYPENGRGIGIGPIAGIEVAVAEMDYDTEELKLTSPDGGISLEYDSGTIMVIRERL